MLKSEPKTYYLLWKYAPEFLPCKKKVETFEELRETYTAFKKFKVEEDCTKWLIENNIQTAIKWLLNKTHALKMVELYNTYFENAKEDVQAFKAFTDFSEKFFASEKDSELLAILNNIGEDDLEV
jgi:hypothetical protein